MPRLIEREFSKSTVATMAQKVRDKFFAPGDSPQEAYDRIFEQLGGKTELVDGDLREETLRVSAKNDFVIYLPFSTSGARDNFTIAHELGHYFLHTDYSGLEVLNHTRRGSNRREWEANWFAAALLMPAQDFRCAAIECENDEMCLALKFGVSPAAARVRISVLGT